MNSQPANIMTVSQFTRRIKGLIEVQLGYVWVSGEISNWRVSPAGHAYFTLKDKDSQVDAVMFRGRLGNVRFNPDNGLEVIVHGPVSVYEKRGNYQIICEEMQPKGMGELQLAFERLKKKLDAEGLFDEEHKKPLPLFPRRIGIVTSPTGAAIRDILHVISRRFANVHIILYPARVQGDEAAPEIVEGIGMLDEWGVDVMIVGRGGGSLEDMWPFNEEAVVRAIHACRTPVISAVGHEIDFTLSDFAADVRAPTPSAAAEIVVQEREHVLKSVTNLNQRLARSLTDHLRHIRHRLAIACSSYVLKRPDELVRQRRQQVDEARMRLETALTDKVRRLRNRTNHAVRSVSLLSPRHQIHRAMERYAALNRHLLRSGVGLVTAMRNRLLPLVAHLDALSPLAILSRGYAIARKMPEAELVRDAAQLKPGDHVSLIFGTGGASAVVEHIEENTNG